MNKKFKIVLVLITIVGLTTLFAQEDESPWGVSCDIYNRYIWRGADFGNNPFSYVYLIFTPKELPSPK